MSTKKGQATGSDEADRLLEQVREDIDEESQKHAIDMQRAALSAELREARQLGDERRCKEIERLKTALLEARRRIGS